MQLVLPLAGMVVMAILAGGVLCWSLAALKISAGQPLIRWTPRRSVPWAFLDLVAVLVLYVLAIVLARAALGQLGWLPDVKDESELTLSDKGLLVWVNMAVSLAIVAVGFPLIALRAGAAWRDFGLALRELLGDLKLGVVAFVMLGPPVYAIQGALVYFWKPSKHPLMEMFKSSPDASFFAVLLLAASVVAPIFEELIFRVLLQGFLEKAFTFRHGLAELILGPWAAADVPAAAVLAEPAPVAGQLAAGDSAPLAGAAEPNPYWPPKIAAEALPAELRDDGLQGELRGSASWLPIAISSVIFALLHVTHGPDWVALTLLAAGMGYVYQRTHRLVPSLVVHALLNSLSMMGLWIQVYVLPQQGLRP